MVTSEEKYKKQLQWFLDRIGKRVFRDSLSYNCESCTCVENNGLIIKDENHQDLKNNG